MNEDFSDVSLCSDSFDLFNANGLDSNDQEFLSSESSEESGEYYGEYEDYFSDVISGINLLHADIESIYFQVSALATEQQILNDNVSVLNENLISCFNLMIVFFVLLVIKMLFGIFNKYLGLGQA